MEYLLYSTLVLILFIAQSFFSGFDFLNNVKVDLLLILVIIIAVNKGKKKGSLMGLLVGLLEDLFFGGLIGVNAISKIIVGFLFGFLNKYVYHYTFILLPIFIAFGTIFNQLIILLLLPQSVFDLYFASLLDNIILPLLASNIIFTIPLYLIICLIDSFISKESSNAKR